MICRVLMQHSLVSMNGVISVVFLGFVVAERPVTDCVEGHVQAAHWWVPVRENT